jgi:hypothetical protein
MRLQYRVGTWPHCFSSSNFRQPYEVLNHGPYSILLPWKPDEMDLILTVTK